MSFLPLHITTKKSGENMATTKPRKKVRKQNIQVEEAVEEKKPSVLQKIFFWVIIPLLFISAVLLIAAEVTGTNVFEKAKQITGTSSNENTNNLKKVTSNNDKQIADLKSQLQEKEAEIAKLQGEVEDSKSANAKTNIEKHRLEVQIKKLEKNKDQVKANFSDIVKTYENMTPKAAAPVITNMKDSEALKILSSLKPAALAAILEKMPSDKAAHFTELLSKNN